jgi:hypothetical protein
MKTTGRRAVAASAALAMAFVAACEGREVPVELVPRESPSLEITVAVTKPEFVRGDSTDIVVTLRNLSPRPVRIDFRTTCTIVYAIRTPNGDLVEPGGDGWNCPPFFSRLELGNLGGIQRVYRWKATGLPNGEYLVYGALGDRMDVVSEPVTVRVTGPAVPGNGS